MMDDGNNKQINIQRKERANAHTTTQQLLHFWFGLFSILQVCHLSEA